MATNHDKKALLQKLPSVDRMLQMPPIIDLSGQYGRSLTTEAIRTILEERRQALLSGAATDTPAPAILAQETRAWLESFLAPTLKPVINATGVIVHTNLGRAPLSEAALTAVHTIGSGYSNLEYDLDAGERGSRTLHAEALLTRLTGAEAALVVNNNAAAVLLMLSALCREQEVIISRGQLVEIGGGFRIPDVMAQSGARLVEVGTTNRTHLADYEQAITENTAAIMVAHYSNYKIIGFTAEPSLAELAELAQRRGVLLLYDQGSGALRDAAPYGLEPEPTVLDGVAAGCDVVAFSGDKLLGGPQAGILVGHQALVAQLKRHPLARAMRADKLCLAALTATLTHYLTDTVTKEIPVWRMISASLKELEETAYTWAARLQERGIQAQVIDGRSTVGGGSLPGASLPTKLVAITHSELAAAARALRQEPTAVVGRVQDGQFWVDPRTVLPKQVEIMLQSLVNCFG